VPTLVPRVTENASSMQGDGRKCHERVESVVSLANDVQDWGNAFEGGQVSPGSPVYDICDEMRHELKVRLGAWRHI
jgi:hypothetical protein